MKIFERWAGRVERRSWRNIINLIHNFADPQTEPEIRPELIAALRAAADRLEAIERFRLLKEEAQ